MGNGFKAGFAIEGAGPSGRRLSRNGFRDYFAIEFLIAALAEFSETQRRRIADTPNIVLQPTYSRRIVRVFDDMMLGVAAERVRSTPGGVTPVNMLKASKAEEKCA